MDEHDGAPNGSSDDLDLLIARFDTLLVRIKQSVKGPPHAAVRVEEEIADAIHHVFNAMELVVDWMDHQHSTDPDALLLLANLKTAGNTLVQCVGACPCGMVMDTL